MLYFDQLDARRFGSIRQQFWALAHFPFHVALVLLLEGTSRFVTWRNAMESLNQVIADLDVVFEISSNPAEVSGLLKSAVASVANNDPGLNDIIAAESFKSNISFAFDTLAASVDMNSEQAFNASEEIVGLLLRSTLKFFNIKASKKATQMSFSPDARMDPFQHIESVLHVYDLVFVYFFVAAGCTLLMMSILIALAKKKKCLGDYVAIVLRAVVGLGLAGLAGIKGNATIQERFLMSPWILPTVSLALGAVVFLDGVFGYFLPAAPVAPKSLDSDSIDSEEEEGKDSAGYASEDTDV